jgi:formylglycine-generating enzyme required for sulfatase activity
VALLAGAKAARGSALNAWALSESLCLSPPPDGPAPAVDHWGALLAGRVLVECADLAQVAPRNRDELERVREWQRAIVRRNTLPATERALAGRTLAMLGDPRPEVTSLDGMHFCFVPPGPFVMGDDQGADEEKPQHTVDLAYPYFIARFPVTVAQWREYVQASGKAAEHRDSLRGRANDPVIYVSWHEALRFCDFLSQAWQALLPEGWVVTLPSEAEWEKAARGGDRVPAVCDWVKKDQLIEKLKATPTGTQMPNPYRERAYPWGDRFDADLANVESTVGETSAVGCYTTGLSPYGCEEMSGNVWEWTRSLWGKDLFKPDFKYPYEPLDGKREDLNAGNDMWRVVRGGSWDYYRDFARCAFRYRTPPGYRFGNFSFRVVLRSAPVP